MPELSEEQLTKELARELGLENLSADVQQKLITQATETLMKRLYVEALEALNEADQEAYLVMLENDTDPVAAEKFLREKITNYDNFVQKITDDFKQAMRRASALDN